MKTLAVAGMAALSVLAIAVPNAQAASKKIGPVKLDINKYCTATLYVDDHTGSNKIRGQAHVGCSRGNAIVTPTINFYRNGKHIRGGSIGPRIINKDKGFSFEKTIPDASGTQCYRASLLIVYPDPADVNKAQLIKTPCLNT
ncbi:hypothetical protein [Streptomyces solaniscabiei]|uniref:hypothetical protein n=1 Tax=Streptomyces solaniscabiei TaxID=2683255 RepID=UPI001CE314D5|nr:hypothetical protein [Streptomyces solaniscabiei]